MNRSLPQLSDPDWRDHAVCRDLPTAIFYPPEGGRRHTHHQALAACAKCPVREDCLADALSYETTGTIHGIRGGLRPQHRHELITGRIEPKTA